MPGKLTKRGDRPPDSASYAVSPARREAFRILLEVEGGTHHADDLLRSRRVSALASQDRNLATALVLGVLRWQIRLDAAIQPLLTRPNARLDPEIRIALRLGAFQLQSLDRIPVHAAISESVALAKAAGHRFASGMVNAVLRKLAGQGKAMASEPRTPAEIAAETAHPAWMVDRWVRFYGLEAARAIALHDQRQPTTALRMSAPEVERELTGLQLEPGELLRDARIVAEGDVTATDAFRNGRVRIQEEGSQLIAELAGSGENVLDLCAAPGGKTLILAARNPTVRIVACEMNPARVAELKRRLAEMRQPALTDRIDVLHSDATVAQFAERFDLVLADVPCSGTGTLGRNPEIRHRLTEADLARHHERQCALLKAGLRAAKGAVIYSTCSLEPEENAEVIAEVLAGEAEWRQVSLAGRVEELRGEGRLTAAGADYLLSSIGADGAMRLLPGRIPTDGFFVALLQRGGEALFRNAEGDEGADIDPGAGGGLLAYDYAGEGGGFGRSRCGRGGWQWRVGAGDGGDGGDGDVLEAGGVELEANAAEGVLGADDGEAGEVGHDEAVGGGVVGVGYQEVDAGLLDAQGFGGRVLGDDGAGGGFGVGQVSGGAGLQAYAAQVEGGDALLVAEDAGDFDLLGAEALGDADAPLAADYRVGGGRLGEDVAGGDVGGVVAVVDLEVEAEAGGLAAGFGDGHVLEGGDADLRAVDGEVHGGDGGDQRHDDKRHEQERALEEVPDGAKAELHGKVSPSANSTTKSISAAFSSMAETEQYLSLLRWTASSAALRLTCPPIV